MYSEAIFDEVGWCEMKRQARPARKRVLRAKRQAVPGVKRRIKAQTVEFAVFGDSHVGYGNSLSIFKSLCLRQ